MAKIRVNVSLNPDTVERLKQYAFENHTTVSGAIETWIWNSKVKNAQLRGQLNFDNIPFDELLNHSNGGI